jgi:hypothetical protein
LQWKHWSDNVITLLKTGFGRPGTFQFAPVSK